jgi:hypothetical protein
MLRTKAGVRLGVFSIGLAVMLACAENALADNPINVVAPTVTGFFEPAETLTASPGEWLDADANSFTYQWQSCAPNYVTTVRSDLPTAWWRFDDDPGDFEEDASGYDHDANRLGNLPIVGLPGAIYEDASSAIGFVADGDELTVHSFPGIHNDAQTVEA